MDHEMRESKLQLEPVALMSRRRLVSVTTWVGDEFKESTMPHVMMKLWPGKSEQQKVRLAEAIAQDVMSVLNYGEESVSVAIEEVKPEDWAEKVYKPDITAKPDQLYKKPGYTM
jgi:4-oxalocrotonate tautomerase